ncbi:sulfhydryl oxidase 1 isoform X1 [Anastrepha obliqua]|uniref:sulfhydryl oxidase 1 isoform X1 n=1 Tax=Anastrepha obliqua TaxID=95512 RepID=UPI0024097129|nr:sulfhydryl oxidase 1 isoform X1 [Anastrepha obliqua]
MSSPRCVGIFAIIVMVVRLSILTSASVIPAGLGGGPVSPELGLYDLNDKVTVLTVNNFNDTVLHQNRSLLVEFYNTFCGHCQRYAPHYKELAERLYPWRETLLVAAIDCNAFENTGICRDYEIFAYPTLRYFSPGYMCKEGNYGQFVKPNVKVDELAANMAQRLVAENGTDRLPNFPNLHSVTENEEKNIFEGLDSNRKLVILAYEPENTTVGLESVLNFHLWPDVQVRRITDLNVANKFQIDGVHYKIATVDRQGNVVPYSVKEDTPQAYVATIQSILEAQHFKPRSVEGKKGVANTAQVPDDETGRTAIISEVLRNKHLVYQADLEMAIRQMLFNEIPKVHEIHGEQLLALQRILGVLQRYHPLGPQGNEVIRRLHEYVLNANESVNGGDFQTMLEHLNKTLGPIFSSNHFVGCVSSQHNKRGYTCSLWTIFHYFTVQAARLEISNDPLEVLTAIHGYVKYFFGCTHCSEHFQAMATRRKIWNVPSKDEAVLWLWAAHNEVNNRLAGDDTEDPQFAKIQFPSESSCHQCRRSDQSKTDVNWDKDAVLSFLKNIHNPGFVSRYGIDNEAVLQPSLDKLRQKRRVGNVFSEMDMRMGMLLYGFCVIMMVVAFKLFAIKGYRKRPYMHDALGKV